MLVNSNITDRVMGGDLIVGINFSGFHDTAMTVMDACGRIQFSTSLERITRVKSDSRSIESLWERLGKNNIIALGVSTLKSSKAIEAPGLSIYHPYKFDKRTIESRGVPKHDSAIESIVDRLGAKDVFFFEHQSCHAASAFYASGFKESIALTYDGGMPNNTDFGSVSLCRNHEMDVIDRFDIRCYPKLSSLYSAITACCGFRPNRHEGKITGLAANGSHSSMLHERVLDIFKNSYDLIESSMSWHGAYNTEKTARLIANQWVIDLIIDRLGNPTKENLAFAVQKICEDEVDMMAKAILGDVGLSRICLAGGLFSNVRINQGVASKFDDCYVAPSMTDDGTSLGAAYLAYKVVTSGTGLPKSRLRNMYLGDDVGYRMVGDGLKLENIVRRERQDLASPTQVAKLLAQGKIIGICRGRGEFGPRALGNRSIIASASDKLINDRVNKKLGRTEFMPFAPICRFEDREEYFIGLAESCAEFMTSTAFCRDIVKMNCPAVVHVDGTARPQCLKRSENQFLHEVLSQYKEISGTSILINTSFNIHEEPIVSDAYDAFATGYIAGLDYVLIGDQLIDLANIDDVTPDFLGASLKHYANAQRERNRVQDVSEFILAETALWAKLSIEKENVINGLLPKKVAGSGAIMFAKKLRGRFSSLIGRFWRVE